MEQETNRGIRQDIKERRKAYGGKRSSLQLLAKKATASWREARH